MTRRTALLSSLLLPGVSGAQQNSTEHTYAFGPDSQRQPGVPQGTVTKHSWTSKQYPGTVRDYWIYVPAQYRNDQPACLMVFQDGEGYVKEDGGWRVPVVFDNLIHKGELPVTIGVFINPGVVPAPSPEAQDRFNRSFEYDEITDWYVTFLLEEILPSVRGQYNISQDPNDCGIGGSSSGGIASFTAAWHRPDAFRRVLCSIGSYTDLRGGDKFPALIRKTEPVRVRVFLQDGTHDLNNFAGDWYLANQQMNSALVYSGYDVQFVVGTEGHNAKHGGSILPDSLRWLWRDHPRPIAKPVSPVKDHYVPALLPPDSQWKLISAGHRFTEGSAADQAGNVFFSDVNGNQIHKVDLSGAVSLFLADSGGVIGMTFGMDGRLYACQNGKKRIVAYSPDGRETVLGEGVNSNDIAVDAKGNIYFTDPEHSSVWHLDSRGQKRVVSKDIEFPNGVRFSTDQSLLFVCDTKGKWVWSFRVNDGGSLTDGEPFFHLEIAADHTASGADGMTVDADGRLWVATSLGIQVCDAVGRVGAILRPPLKSHISNIIFGGRDRQTLFATAGDKVFSRPVNAKGTWGPVKPPKPRL